MSGNRLLTCINTKTRVDFYYYGINVAVPYIGVGREHQTSVRLGEHIFPGANRGSPMELPIPDRSAAGRALAQALKGYARRDDVIVLALPRGGVPVAAEIADALGAPLDVMLVRKLGLPGYRELAMGAIASGGVRVMNESVLLGSGVTPETVEAVVAEEREELQRRERVYRGERPWPELRGRCVILVDDGLATGATMRAAVDAVRAQQPNRIVVAVPVAPPDTVQVLEGMVDEVVCPQQPEPFMAIGQWYLDFSQVTDREVQQILNQRWRQGDEAVARRTS